jgi:ribosomal protein L37AE/L43A
MIEYVSRVEYCPRCDDKTLHHNIATKRTSDWVWPLHIIYGIMTLGMYFVILAIYKYTEHKRVERSPWCCRVCDNKLARTDVYTGPLIRSKTWK